MFQLQADKYCLNVTKQFNYRDIMSFEIYWYLFCIGCFSLIKKNV
jgi:hypothetical protein